MKTKNIQLQQLDSRIREFKGLRQLPVPQTGWVRSVRMSIGMSLEQLGRRLGITRQSAMDMERRELEGTISMKALREAATAMDMELVYGFVPKDGSLQALINRKAYEIASEIVARASQTMILEDQGNSSKRLGKAIEERAIEIREKTPKILWD